MFKIIRWQLKPLTYWPELTSQISFHIVVGRICSGSYQPPVAPLKGEIKICVSLKIIPRARMCISSLQLAKPLLILSPSSRALILF